MNEPGFQRPVRAKKVLILGIGNSLLQDDGAGIHVSEQLQASMGDHPQVSVVDGGTLGLSLLPELESADGLIVVDAGEIGEDAGQYRVYEGDAMDRQLSGNKTTVHELAMSDLLSAATLSGHRFANRALVAIQPGCIEWGLSPTEPVRDAIPAVCELVDDMAREWME